MIPLAGFSVRVYEYMAGAKRAVLFRDGTLLVSPAMLQLIEGAEEWELERLLDRIPVVRLPWPADVDPMGFAILPEPFTEPR